MTGTIVLNPRWEECCIPRMGVAELTQMAFQGTDLRPLWHELMNKATDDAAGSGMGMDLSIIAQLLGDKATGLAIQNDMLALQRLYRSPCAAGRPRLRVLALAAVMDIGGNTPLEFLLQGSGIELATFYAVPGMAIQVHFTATKTGEYEIACAELCGMQHYKMRARLLVMTDADFDSWLKSRAAL